VALGTDAQLVESIRHKPDPATAESGSHRVLLAASKHKRSSTGSNEWLLAKYRDDARNRGVSGDI